MNIHKNARLTPKGSRDINLSTGTRRTPVGRGDSNGHQYQYQYGLQMVAALSRGRLWRACRPLLKANDQPA